MQQMKEYGVTDEAVLAALHAVPRAWFVAEPQAEEAEDDYPLPIGEGQTISQPTLVGLVLQELQLSPGHEVLEVGTGSGWQAALLSRLCAQVYTVERVDALYREAGARFRKMKINNISAILADGAQGWPQKHVFDRIVVAAAAGYLPEKLVEQLSPEGGILIIPLAHQVAGDTYQHLVKCVRQGQKLSFEPILPVRFVPLLSGVAQE